MISINAAVSNEEDWTIEFYAVDEVTGNPIDFTGGAISFNLTDQNGCGLFKASTITLPQVGLVSINIDASQMKTLVPGSYPFGCAYLLNGTTAQLFVGSASIYDGIASI